MSSLVDRAARVTPSRHPEWWVYALAVAAGFVLLVDGLDVGAMGAGSADHAAMTSGMHPSTWAGRLTMGMDHWFLMVLAMMLPLTAPQVRGVAVRSLWQRRHRSAAFFAAGHVAVWLVAGVVLVAIAASLVPTDPPGWLVPALLVVAALWHVSPPRRRAMRRCGAVRLRQADGPAADQDCLLLGARAGAWCVVSCGVVMLPMVVDPMAGYALPLMATVLAILLSERASGPNPATRPGRPHEAVALLVVAAVLAVLALLPATA